MISSAQCRAARGLLNWTQNDLASAAGVGATTVRQFELAGAVPRSATLAVISLAFERAGVELIPENGGGPGVRLKKAGHVEDSPVPPSAV